MNADVLANSDAWAIETDSLIDGALAAVREAANLDDDPVLPPLPARTPRRDVVVLRKVDLPLPSPSEIVRASARAPSRAVAATTTTRGLRWPVILCGFVASLAAGAAFMASPLGHSPSVQHAASLAHAKVSAVVHR